MAILRLATLALLGMRAIGAYAAKEPPKVESDEIPDDVLPAGQPVIPSILKVSLDTVFPDSVFGVKLVNGHTTTAHIAVSNQEDVSVKVSMVGGSLWPLDVDISEGPGRAVRNLTTNIYNVEIPPNGNQSLMYSFSTELHPQNLRLIIAAVVEDGEGKAFQFAAYNGTVDIVEAPLSILDPQMLFLYLFLSACFAGTCYFIYSTWFKAFFPSQPKRRTAASGSGGSRKRNVISSPPDSGSEATSTGAKSYDESWIPAQNLQRPEARRVKSGTPKTKAK